jgi:DinB superfamily
MLKRTKGRILLTMLVITGLAGTINNSTLSNQERKFAVSQLKDTRTELLSTIKKLSTIQLEFKSSPDSWSIGECISHISLTEKLLWDKLELAMKQSANPEKRLALTFSDEDLLKSMEGRSANSAWTECLQTGKEKKPPVADALATFKSVRTAHLKYVKTTTEDLRNHFIQLPIGWIDCYQSIIFMAFHSNKHISQINEILADPRFPKK